MSDAVYYRRDEVVGDSVSTWTKTFTAPRRIQTNILARAERRVLNKFCESLPAWVMPDHLTVLGITGAVVTALGYLASNWSPYFFFLASFGLLVNWFGDSLDGSLARYRKIERPRYGYFVDHSVDAISEFLIIAGLGLSPYVGLTVALFALSAYFALSLYVFLLNQISGEFRLTFVNLGPTEVRLVVIWFNFAMFLLGPAHLSIFGLAVPLHAASIGLVGAVLVAIFVVNVYKTARELARQSESERKPSLQRIPTISRMRPPQAAARGRGSLAQ